MNSPSKPTITELDANRLVFLAGVKAEKEAAAAGVSPDESSTLLNAGAGGRVIGGITFPPIHAAYQLMLHRVGELAEKRQALGSPMGSMAALAFLLKEPQLAWRLLQAEDGGQLFDETVTEFAMALTMKDLAKVAEWIKEESDRLNPADDAGKPASA
jgi:hypothetical protein